MKAKELVKMYEEASDKDAVLNSIYIKLFDEVGKIAEMRQAKTNSAFKAIFREQNDKWNSFARQINKKHNDNIAIDGFMKLSEKRMAMNLTNKIGT